MKCPYCGSNEDKVIDSRSVKDDAVTRRRRECVECGKRFTTYERIEECMPLVIKRDGSRQPYDQSKIKKGLIASCVKRSISSAKIDEIIFEVEQEIQKVDVKEIDSKKIGENVMKFLKATDKVAYIRFASVYKDFKGISDFIDQIKEFNVNSGE